MKKPVWKVLITILFLFNAPALPQKSPDKISFIPHWLPQAQFAGYYAAYELGIYKKYNIDLNILTGGPQKPSTEVIKKREADFASLWLINALQLREQGYEIINIGQIIRRSVFMLIAKKSSGIKEPKDMNGKKVGLWDGFQTRPMEFFNKFGIKVKPVALGSTINLFLSDGIDVMNAMYYNEYHKIINSGLDSSELVTFSFSDYGLNFPEEGIYVYKDFYEKNPDLCGRFIKATLEGWIWCFNNPDKAVNIVIKYMKTERLPVNLSQQNWMLSVFRDLLLDKKTGQINTELSKDDYDLVVRTLGESGELKKAPLYEQFAVKLKGSK